MLKTINGRSNKNMTRKDFKNIKMLIEMGLPYKQLIQITNRSHGTISGVKRSDNWADYKQRTKAAIERARKSRLQTVPTFTLESPLEGAVGELPKMEQVAITSDVVATSELIVALTDLRNSIKELSGALEVKDSWTRKLLGN